MAQACYIYALITLSYMYLAVSIHVGYICACNMLFLVKELLLQCACVHYSILSISLSSLSFCDYHVCISMLGLLYTKHCIMYRCLSVCVCNNYMVIMSACLVQGWTVFVNSVDNNV